MKLENLWKEYEYRRLTLRSPLPPAAEIGSISSGGEGKGCEGIRGHYRQRRVKLETLWDEYMYKRVSPGCGQLRFRPPLPWKYTRRPVQVLCRHVDWYILSLAGGPEEAK